MNRLICPARVLRLLPGLALLLAGMFPLHVIAQSNTVPTAAAPPGRLKVLNREVMIFRASLGTYTPEQRRDAAKARIELAMTRIPGVRVEALPWDGKVELRVHGQTVFFIMPGDVDELAGETLESLRVLTEHRLNQAIGELEELHSHRYLIKAGAFTIGTTVGLIAFIWMLGRNRRWLENRLIKLAASKADQIKSHSLRTIGLQNVVAVLRSLTSLVFWLVVISVLFLWLEFELQLFPLTRPFGEELHKQFLSTLGQMGQSALESLPDLCIVMVIGGLARFASTANRRFFVAIARGKSKSRFFDPTTAPITQRLITLLIWLTAIIVAFPYIPGSQTPAFRGISVMAGLMISVGSSNLIAQLIGGLTVIYNRACRPGDYIQIGEYEGTVASIGFFSSRLVTRRNEEVVLANSQISNGTLINYTTLNESVGVQVPLTVTIGYDTPWRQVHAMLLEAARRTAGLKSKPEHIVLQRALSDFYVEYELRVALATPMQRPEVLSELHAHTQDVFNEYGVQIMSPHFLANPPQAAVVPKEKWFAPPAKKDV